MAGNSKIEWCTATWNPIVGCSLASPGCANCYAMRQAHRLAANPATPHYRGTTTTVKGKPVWTGHIARAPDRIMTQPLTWRRPEIVFVNSMGDLFHPDVPVEAIDEVWAVMAMAPQHWFIVLTKHPKRMRDYLTDQSLARCDGRGDAFMRLAEQYHPDPDATLVLEQSWPLPNIALGVSVEDQRRAEERIPPLLTTPAALRLLSVEPLLEAVDLAAIKRTRAEGFMRPLDGRFNTIDGVFLGGESGPGARPMHPDWARSIRDQCMAAGVPFFFKQWGAWLPWEPDQIPLWRSQNEQLEDHHGLFPSDFDQDPNWDDGLWAIADNVDHAAFQKVGKKAAGRLLDGREWNQLPAPLQAVLDRRLPAPRLREASA